VTSELRIILKSHYELRKGDMLDYTMYMYFFLSYCVFVSSLPQSIFEICAARENYSFCLIIGRISDHLHYCLNFRRHLWKKTTHPTVTSTTTKNWRRKKQKQKQNKQGKEKNCFLFGYMIFVRPTFFFKPITIWNIWV
jgi:hypothetical protein